MQLFKTTGTPPQNIGIRYKDVVAPVVSSVVPACNVAGTNGWCLSATNTVTITDNNDGSGNAQGIGVKSRTYNVTGGASGTYTSGAPIPVTTGDGTFAVAASATDWTNNASAPVSGAIKVDTTAPSLGANESCSLPGDNGWCRGTLSVSPDAADATSGIATKSCTLDGNPISCGSATDVTDPGEHTVSVSATDNAGNSASQDFTVKLDAQTSIEYSGDTEGFGLETAAVSATLTDTSHGVPLQARTVTFTLGSQSATATTDENGLAATTIDLSDTPGNYTVSASYAGEDGFADRSGSAPFTIHKRPTSTVYLGDASGKWNDLANLRASVTDVRKGLPAAGASVTFTLGSGSATTTTDALGIAAAPLLLGDVPADYTVSASAGDALYDSSSDAAGFTILKRATTLSYTGDTEGFWKNDAALSARITDTDSGAAIEGVDVGLSLGSAVIPPEASDSDGTVSTTVTLDDAPGAYTAAALFTGNDYYEPSAGSDGFTTRKRPTTLTYDGDTSGDHGGTATMSATLTDTLSGAPLAGKPVHFTLGSFAGDPDPTTSPDGKASVTAPLDQNSGDYTAAASFADDGFYGASGDSTSFTIGWEYAFVDDDQAGSIFIDTSTKQFAFKSGDGSDSSGTIDDANMLVLGSSVLIAYNDGSLTVVGVFDLDSGSFAATVATASGTYALRHTPALPEPPCDVPQGCLPNVLPSETPSPSLPPTPEPAVPSCAPNPIGDPVCP
ncbi:MAG: hypothetical protein LC750_03225 [Actinobacteria bacterium]|nr:hypothetical protein [Actinomycetota bacterium]